MLHTADWHVGRALRGRSRADEHRAVLAEIASVAAERKVDLILVTGDLFDSAAPSPESEAIVYDALLALARLEVPVVLCAGNHDHPQRLRAVRPLLELGGVHVGEILRRPEEGGVLQLDLGGTPVAVATMPFLSQRNIVKADALMSASAEGHRGMYAERARRIIEELTAGMPADAIRILAGHLTVTGGVLGGGEREAHTVFEYEVPAEAFPASLHYVALGHLHRAQRIAAKAPIAYCGSPLQLDFGETLDVKSVSIVELGLRRPARVDVVPLRSGKRLRTLRAGLEQLESLEGKYPDDFLQVIVETTPQAGLADRVRELLPHAVDVRIAPRRGADEEDEVAAKPDRSNLAPQALFEAYLEERGEEDPRLRHLFEELLEEADATAPA